MPESPRNWAKVECCHRGAELTGYAVVVRDDKRNLGLSRSRIADIFVEKDDPQAINRLLEGTYQCAMSVGSHGLEVMGFPPSIRDVILRNGPYSRSGPNLPYFFRARDIDLLSELQQPDKWYACPFDGDASL